MKKIVFLVITIAIFPLLKAQNIQIKNDIVFVDNKEVFKCKSENNNGIRSITLIDLHTNEELIFIKEDNGGTSGYRDDDYTIYMFLKEKVKVEISTYNLWKYDIKFLFKQGVFDLNGQLDNSKITFLKEKFDENITEKRAKR